MLKQDSPSCSARGTTASVARIQPIVDEINSHYERLQDVPEEELRAQTAKFRGILRERTDPLEARVAELKERKRTTKDPAERDSDRQRAGRRRRSWRRGERSCATVDRGHAGRDPPGGIRDRARGGAPPAGKHGFRSPGTSCVGHGALRRAAHGRHRAAPREDRRNGDRRRQDARRDAAAVPQRAAGKGRAPGHGELVPRPPRLAVDGAPVHVPRAHGRLPRRHRARDDGAPRRVPRATSRTARTTSSASTTCATTW